MIKKISIMVLGIFILINLNDTWTDNEFNILRRQILTLSVTKGIRRNGYKEDIGFEIFFNAPEFPDGGGKLSEEFMDAGWGKLEGEIEIDGTVKLRLDAKVIGIQEYELPEKFEKIFSGYLKEEGVNPLKISQMFSATLKAIENKT